MTCETVRYRDGRVVHFCMRGTRTKKCRFCDNSGEFECDAPNPRKKSGHCDALMCSGCRTKIGDQELGDEIDTIDYCPECVEKTTETREGR